MINNDKIILHLCCDQGSDSIYYKKNGYDVRLITKEIGIENYHPPKNVYGIIANPLTKRTALWGNFNAPVKPLFINQQKTKQLIGQLTSCGSPKRSECYLEFAKHFFYNNQ